ncbi:hypothetical protein LAZ67_7001095 [Cordylochernes scorpioides]|uniref:Uncharacterized protein n=1 Tax=Cordylochernes scorpioides TaxID=51811 RepID=A0ABY6KS17_9ARAC|nr:hypothetical protein LAZ67_7001095 [Cordylochernes scorpioides]
MDQSDLPHGQDTATTSVGRYCDQGAWTDLICSMDKTPLPPQLAGCMDRSDLLHGQDTTTTSVGRPLFHLHGSSFTSLREDLAYRYGIILMIREDWQFEKVKQETVASGRTAPTLRWVQIVIIYHGAGLWNPIRFIDSIPGRASESKQIAVRHGSPRTAQLPADDDAAIAKLQASYNRMDWNPG